MNVKSKMTRTVVLAIVLVAAGAWAQGVPQQLSFTANLSNSGAPATGNHSFVFTLFDAVIGGTVTWTETQATVAVNNGLVFTRLGLTTPLTPTILNGAPLWLEVSVDGTALSPRAPVASVPYAIRAGVANSAESLGALLASEVQKRVNGTCAGANAIQSIDADGGVGCVAIAGGTGDITAVNTSGTSGLAGGALTGDVNLSLATCPINQVLKSTGTGWSCQADSNSGGTVTSITAGAGLMGGAITGVGTIAIGNGAVTNGMLASSSLTVTAGAGLSGGGNVGLGGSTTLGLMSCPVGQILGSTTNGWVCQPDANTTYGQGTGIIISSGNLISVDSSLVARKDAAAGNQVFDVSTLVLDYTNNRVGVGIPAPLFPLDVAGDVQAGGFRFATPQAGRVISHPSSCVRVTGAPSQDTVNSNPPTNAFGPSIVSNSVLANSMTDWYCPIDIRAAPGATITITGATLSFYDSSSTCRIQAELRWKQFGSMDFGTIVSTVYSGTGPADFASTVGLPATKAFPNFAGLPVPGDRMVWINAIIAFNAAGGGDCRYSGVLIDYTTDRP